MPYIKLENREYFKEMLEKLDRCAISTPGELNFLFIEVVKQYMVTHAESYQTYNDIFGALECCQFELYRRKIAGYEDKKVSENGDVFVEVKID
jgi:hypothetical protein